MIAQVMPANRTWPAPVLATHAPWLSAQRLELLVRAFIVLGVALRLLRFFLRFPLWEDEAFQAYNLMNRDYAGLLTPPDFGQVAPIGYLWLQRALIEVLGFSEYSLRLTALVAGIGSLFMLRRVAALTLPAPAQLCAVAVFAVSYPMVRYSAEAKPYGLDLLFALALVWLYLEWRRAYYDPHRAQPARGFGWLAALAALVPLAVFMSHPVVFMGGALSLALAWDLRRRPCVRGWVCWLVFNVLMCGTFVGHYLLDKNAIGQEADAFMVECWKHTFPPLRQPSALPGWLVVTHAGEFLAYPFGSGHGGSTLTFLVVLVGLLSWWRRGGMLLFIALAPLALHFIAAALERYPYGGHVKFGMYWAPLGVLLAGTGMAAVCGWLDRARPHRPVAHWVGLGFLALVAAVILGRDLSGPHKTRSDQRARDFARWFWHDAPHDAVVACLHSDLGLHFSVGATRKLNWFASYAVYQRIYSERHARGNAVAWDRVAAGKDLRCVEYRCGSLPYDNSAQQAWLQEMSAKFTLVGRDRYPVPRYDQRERTLICLDYLEIYKFRAGSIHGGINAQP